MDATKPAYADYPAYRELVAILENAGFSIEYGTVHDDSIDGAIWARTDADGMSILMPVQDDSFPNGETAAVILGHEAAHVLLGVNSPDEPAKRYRNEAQCDFVGAVLFELAEMTAGARAERELMRFALEANDGR